MTTKSRNAIKTQSKDSGFINIESYKSWKPPEEGFIKINVAAILGSNDRVSLGIVGRDSLCRVVLLSIIHGESESVQSAELGAIGSALFWGAHNRWKRLIIKSDSSKMIEALNGESV